MTKQIYKFISLFLCFLLCFEQSSFAQVAAQLNIAGHLAALHNSLPSDIFRPLHLRYLSFNPLENNFKLLLDKGSLNNHSSQEIENTSKILMQYFFIGLTLQNDTFWVNLRPDSPDKIIDDKLAQTDIGKIMLETDLQLKKDTASFTSPQTSEGKEYWDKLYKKAEELYGTDTVTIPTLTRPWIVPGEIIIRETSDSAYIYKATLKVMLEQDYLKDTPNAINAGVVDYSFKDERSKALNEYSTQLIRELIIPKLTKEVNSSKRYAALRQVYYSLIMAQWFKSRFKLRAQSMELGGKNQNLQAPSSMLQANNLYRLIDSQNLTRLTSKQEWNKDTYFNAYKKSFAEGEYNIQELVYTPTGQVIRSYFSGGEMLGVVSSAMTVIPATGRSALLQNGNLISFSSASPMDPLKAGFSKDLAALAQTTRPRPLPKLTWQDEQEVLTYMRILMARFEWPLPHKDNPFDIQKLKQLAGDRTPYQYYEDLYDDYDYERDRIGSAYYNEDSALAHFVKTFDIWKSATTWFKYATQLESIKKYVESLPAFRPIRIFVHGTWNGEDAYSIAIMLRHFFPGRQFIITGADYVAPNPRELNWIAGFTFPEYLAESKEEYFIHLEDDVFELKEVWRSLVQGLSQGDVRDQQSFPENCDIVVVNGVLGQSVYKDEEIATSIDNAWRVLNPGGRLYVDNRSYRAEGQRDAFRRVITARFVAAGKLSEITDGIYEKSAPKETNDPFALTASSSRTAASSASAMESTAETSASPSASLRASSAANVGQPGFASSKVNKQTESASSAVASSSITQPTSLSVYANKLRGFEVGIEHLVQFIRRRREGDSDSLEKILTYRQTLVFALHRLYGASKAISSIEMAKFINQAISAINEIEAFYKFFVNQESSKQFLKLDIDEISRQTGLSATAVYRLQNEMRSKINSGSLSQYSSIFQELCVSLDHIQQQLVAILSELNTISELFMLETKDTLKQKIEERGGKVTFEEFMAISLYSKNGYYSGGVVNIGAKESAIIDFMTYPEMAPLAFGSASAEQLVQMWENMGRPSRFQIVEMGAGNGTWASRILEYLKEKHQDLFKVLDYIIVEISPELVKRQKEKLENKAYPVKWVLGSAIDLPLKDIEGVFISNELPDAFPIHKVKRDANREIKEVYVTYQDGLFKEELGDISDQRINDYIEMIRQVRGNEYLDKTLSNNGIAVNLNMMRWQEAVYKSLKRGYVVTIDYGFDEKSPVKGKELDPIRIYSSTYNIKDLEANPAKYTYLYPGQVDITSNVDFKLLAKIGAILGFTKDGSTQQYQFLLNIRRQRKELADYPLIYLSDVYHVIIQSKGVPQASLIGLYPDPPSAAAYSIENKPAAGLTPALSDNKVGFDGSTSAPAVFQDSSLRSESIPDREVGGIDFRSLPIVTQAMTNLRVNLSASPLQLQAPSPKLQANLNEEWQSIEKMASSGIKPSAERIKEYAQASSALDKISQDKDKIISCISNILRQEEEENCVTDPLLRDILIVFESIQQPEKLKEVFLGKPA